MSSNSSVSSAASNSSSSGLTSSAPISFSGIASGIDTTSIIQKLVQVEQLPITALQNKITGINTKQQALATLKTSLQALQAASQQIRTDFVFNIASGTSSDTSVATITTANGAKPGSYNLAVTQLATAQKVASSAQAGVSTALNQNGTFIVDGKAVTVSNGDTLVSIAQKINSLGLSVAASVIDGGQGNGYLTIASTQTGAANKIQLSDLSGNVLQSLGVLGSTASAPNQSGNADLSGSFSDQTTAVGTFLNLSSPPSGSITVNGVNVNVDLATDSLSAIAANINAANTGATASVVPTTTNGVTTYQLSIAGSGAAPTLTDPNNILGSIGVLQNNYANQLTAANDANFSLDGVALTSATNTVASAIPGATLTLLKGSQTSSSGAQIPSSTAITLSNNTSAVASDIQGFVTAYNAVADFVSQNSQLDKSNNYATGPLFGDFSATQSMSSITSFLFNTVPGTSGAYTNIASLGMSLNQSGDLALDSTKLSDALTNNYSSVAALFSSTGTASNSNIAYVTSSDNTVPSTNPYAVNITQVATQGSYTAESAQTSVSTSSELLKFSGSLFGGSNYTLTLPSGNDLNATINAINTDKTLKNLVVASSNNGSLQITSRLYGTPGSFKVVSNQQASSSNSGIGVGSLGTTVAGLDVAGTINGEAATGKGQFLTGNSGNATTDGLEIEYQGVTTGNVGTISVSKGVASQMTSAINGLLDSTNGILTSENNSLTTQISDYNSQIAQLQKQSNAYELQLEVQFNNMETAISQLNAQSAAINSLTNSLNGSSSSSSSSSSSGSSSSSSSGSLHA